MLYVNPSPSEAKREDESLKITRAVLKDARKAVNDTLWTSLAGALVARIALSISIDAPGSDDLGSELP